MKPELYPSLEDIDNHHKIVEDALFTYFDLIEKDIIKPSGNVLLIGATPDEVSDMCFSAVEEENRRACFALMTYIEATFKAHFIYTVDNNMQSQVTQSFMKIYNSRNKHGTLSSNDVASKISFKDDILKTWVNNGAIGQAIYNQFVDVFQFRNWFAHGRFFKMEPSATLGKQIQVHYQCVYQLAKQSKNLCLQAASYLS